MLRTPVLLVWCLYVLLVPFYVFKGGLPQPGDFLIFVLVPMAFHAGGASLPRKILPSVRALFLFTGWVVIVDLSWALILQSHGFNLMFPAYYVYNTAFFVSALVLYRRFGHVFLKLTLSVILISVVFQVAASFVIVSTRRGALFFSNPNQLGYYALLCGCVIALGHKRINFGALKTSVSMVACTYLTVLSGSRSAAAGLVFLVVLIVFTSPRMIVLASFLAASLMFVGGPIESSIERLQVRINKDRNSHLTFFEQRGYDRIWANKEHLLFGAGEGNTERFADSTAFGHGEIHSSAGMLLFCYGSIGVILFTGFLIRLIQGLSLRVVLMLAPPLIYGFAHQGLRFTMLWVLLALFAMHKLEPSAGIKTDARPA